MLDLYLYVTTMRFNPFIHTSDQDKKFSLHYQYNIMQVGDENKGKYTLWDY